MEKRDILLLFFCLPIAGKKEILSPIQIMKSMFLLSKENEIKDFYRFHPYLYGPCSLEVYKDIDSLVRDGFISQVPSSHRRKYF